LEPQEALRLWRADLYNLLQAGFMGLQRLPRSCCHSAALDANIPLANPAELSQIQIHNAICEFSLLIYEIFNMRIPRSIALAQKMFYDR